MEYKHINDCWNKVRECKKASELEKAFGEFPRWSGDWNILVANGTITVVNSYWDEQCEEWNEDLEDVEVEYDLDVDSKYY